MMNHDAARKRMLCGDRWSRPRSGSMPEEESRCRERDRQRRADRQARRMKAGGRLKALIHAKSWSAALLVPRGAERVPAKRAGPHSIYSASAMSSSSVKVSPEANGLQIRPSLKERPRVIRPKRPRAAAVIRAKATARAHEAGRVRRSSIGWVIRVAAWTSAAFLPLALVGMRNPQLLSGGDAGAPADRLWLYGGFAGLVAIAAFTGIFAAVREDAALARLRSAARHLTPHEAARLAAQLSALPGDENREAISVLRERLEREPREVTPAAALAGCGAEVSPTGHGDDR